MSEQEARCADQGRNMRFVGVPPELVERCQQGDESAFETLYQMVQTDLYGLLWSILRNHDDVDEALQECLVRMLRYIASLRTPERFAFWLTRIAVNQARSVLRRKRSPIVESLDNSDETDQLPARIESLCALSGDNPVAQAIAHEQREIINQALAKLSPRQRSAIVLYENEELTIVEIAKILGCSVGAVKFHLFTARRRLRALLRPILAVERSR